MRCPRCGGRMEARLVQFCACNVTPPIMIANVPAEVCVRCGGEVFADSTVEVFERIRDGFVRPDGWAYARFFDFAGIQPVMMPVVSGDLVIRYLHATAGTESVLSQGADSRLVYAN